MIRILLVSIVLLLAGCNWAEPPLPNPNAERDSRLVGEWSAIGDQKLELRISPLEEKKYRVIIVSDSSRMEFTGYHTDVDGIRIVSLELHDSRLGEGRAMRWLLLSYEFHADGTFSPLFLSREVLPRLQSRDDYLKFSGEQIFTSLSGAAKTEYYRTRFFDTATQKITFKKKEPNQTLQTTPPAVTPRADARVAPSGSVSDL